MKTFRYVLLFIATVFSLNACHKQETSQTSGTITDIQQNTITLLTDEFKCAKGEQKQGDLTFEWEKAAAFQIGDRVKITIQGPIRETFPAVAEVMAVEKLAN